MREASELSRARSRAWGVLSRLILRGVDGAGIESLGEIAGIADAWPRELDAEAIAVEHHAAFELEVLPYGGVFLEVEGMAGGARVEAATQAYRDAGFGPAFDEVAPDHLGVMLGFMSFVEAAEAEAREDGREDVAFGLERATAEFLDRHLLSWLPAMAAATSAHGRRPWAAVVELALGLAVHRRSMLVHPVVAFALPDPGDVLADPRTDLRRIGRVLATPAWCGALLSRTDFASVGRALERPAGFGTRAQTAANLLYAAAEYGSIAAVVEALGGLIEARAAWIAAAGIDSKLVEPWREAAARTRTWLGALAAGAAHHAHEAQTGEAMLTPAENGP